jgi:hypothetical protein
VEFERETEADDSCASNCEIGGKSGGHLPV